MTQHRIGFSCDRCGKQYASRRHNDVDGDDVCDECYDEDEDDTDPMTQARKQSNDDREYDDWGRPISDKRRDYDAKAAHFNREAERRREAMAWARQHGTNYPDPGGCDECGSA